MEQPADILPVTSEEARFEVRFDYTSELWKRWRRRPLRTDRKVLRVIMIVFGTFVTLDGFYRLWQGIAILWTLATEEYLKEMYLEYYSWSSLLNPYLFQPLILLALGVCMLLLERIQLRRDLKQMAAIYGPEPWPEQYLFGEKAFTDSFCRSNQTIPYLRARKVEEKRDFLILWVGKEPFRLPKSAVTKGTPEELLAFLREKVPDRK